MRIGLLSTGDVAADWFCSLATSARGARLWGFFGVVVEIGFGAGRV